jgi:FlaA1/EpsC-like NDP-sugar epimerase
MLVARRNRPIVVSRSLSALKLPYVSRVSLIVRNFKHWNGLPPRPGRTCRNRMGDPMVSRTATAAAPMMGPTRIAVVPAMVTSKVRFSRKGHPCCFTRSVVACRLGLRQTSEWPWSARPRKASRTVVQRILLTYRRFFVIIAHLAMWTASLLGAFLLRFEFHIPPIYLSHAVRWLAVLLVVRTVVHASMGLFHGLWRYSGSRDLIALVKAATLSTAAFALAVTFFGPQGLPRSIVVMDWLGSIVIVGGVRFSIRAIREIAVQAAAPPPEGRKRLLIVGAGDAGEMLIREIARVHAAKFEPVGFVDDDKMKVGERIHGVPVLGALLLVPTLVEKHHVDEVIIAIPSASGKEMRKIVDLCSGTGAHIRTLPGVDKLIDGRVTVNQLQAVKIEDLLGRDPVVLDNDAINAFVRSRVVLVTGAGGSIGSELCKQVARFGPRKIVLVEQAENNLFHIHRMLVREFPDVPVIPCVADICDTKRMDSIFAGEKPHVVFHAAAHKHVPMMEENPGEAIKNNVFGTKKLADISAAHHVEKFVMVSTDKAVNPTSVMGVSKRTAEIYVQSLSHRTQTQFVTVRFGNVLGSAGSVIPLFQEQIAAGGPVNVTHPEMKRYFMTIPEACQLILQAGAMGSGGEIFVLDMGEPVKIVDLARDLIKLNGLVPGEDIEIKFTGIRPGEKLFEELATDDEHADRTKHPKIFIGKFRPYDATRVELGLAQLHMLSGGTDREAIKVAFESLVPEYRGARAENRGEPTPRPERLSDAQLN